MVCARQCRRRGVIDAGSVMDGRRLLGGHTPRLLLLPISAANASAMW
jgi:hypothetical protein